MISKILVIDDKPDNLISISALLNTMIPQCEVITALSGPEGIEKAETEAPDVVLLDIRMPGMDGFEVCTRLKSNENTHLIPVIMLTALQTESRDLVRGLDSGADAYLTKPINENVLAAHVKTALRMKEAEDRLRRQKDALQDLVREKTTALWESEKKYRGLFESLVDGVAECDLDGRIISCNQACLQMTGHTEETIKKLDYRDLTPEKWRRTDEIQTKMALERGHSDVYEKELLRKNRSVIPISIRIWSRHDHQGKPIGFWGIVRDITERKKAEQQLQESEAFQKTLMNAVPTPIFYKDREGRYVGFNRAFETFFGKTKNELIGKTVFDISPPDLASIYHKQDNELLNRGGLQVYESQVKNAYGDTRDVIFNKSVYHDHVGNVTGLIGAILDITERRKAEEERKTLQRQLQQAQKMESIGTLAGGIAHDFNNILSPIMLHTEMAMMDLPVDSPLQQTMKHIYRSGERARDLVKQILTFARKQEASRVPIIISLVVKGAIGFLRSALPSTIDIRYDFKTEHTTVLADPTQMNQVLINLCTNAAYEMRNHGGLLKITLNEEYIGSNETKRFSGYHSGFYLRLSVEDTGNGIPPDIIDKIFEPYFTTKATGEGTGMGLALVHGIVKSHGGEIYAESEPGKGAVFHVLLPIVEEEVTPTREKKRDLPKGNERILLVDDEEMAVNVVRPMLERLGYQVTAKTSSLEALQTFQYDPHAFDIVITDQTMPNMTGKELTRELTSIRPDIPIILCTGFSDSIDAEQAREAGIRAFAMKPVVMRNFAAMIRDVLDGTASRV